MSDQFWVSFWSNIPALIAAVGSSAAMLFSIKMNRHLKEVHQQVNSRMDQLLLVTAAGAKAEGAKEESERQTR